MPLYDVCVIRTETITYRIDAIDEDDAVERYLADGDEIFARTLDCYESDVQLVTEEPQP